MAAYSFLDVNAAISGPGGSFSLKGDNAKEGIAIAAVEDKNILTTGADGGGMHSLVASDAVTVTIRLLQSSPINTKLMKLYTHQKQSSATWGRNTLSIRDAARGDDHTVEEAAFQKAPDLNYATEGGTVEWVLQGIKGSSVIGDGAPEAE